jgi:hypothetical protein
LNFRGLLLAAGRGKPEAYLNSHRNDEDHGSAATVQTKKLKGGEFTAAPLKWVGRSI